MNIQTRNNILTLVLGVLILFLGYWLYHSIVDPYRVVIEEEQMTQSVQQRMTIIRDALIQYRNEYGNFPSNEGGLDSLAYFADSISQVNTTSNLAIALQTLDADSMKFSPRPPHNMFEYTLNDTMRPPIYLLEDPDSDLRVGDLQSTSLMNAPSWN